MKPILFVIIAVVAIAVIAVFVFRVKRAYADVQYLLNDHQITPEMLSVIVSDYNIEVRQQDSSLDGGVIRHYFYTM